MNLQRRSRRSHRAAGVLALALVFTGSVGAQGGPSPALVAAFTQPCTQVELRRRLAGLAPGEVPGMFRASAEGVLPGAGGEIRPMGAEWRRVVRESLATRPRRELIPFLEELASRAPTLAESLEAQVLLEAMGTADHFRLLVRVTCPGASQAGLRPDLRTGFEAALAAMLARDPAGLGRIQALLSESPPGLSGAIAEALAKQGSPAATRCLASLLGRAPGLDGLLLLRLAARDPLPAGDAGTVLESVRRYLRQRDPALLSAAAQATGRLGDEESVDALVELLAHEDGRVRSSAIDALTRLTGLDYGPDPVRWARWHRDEVRWWEHEADSLLVHVERGRGLEFVRASREVLEHRLYRGRIARAFALALARAQDEEAELACQALGRLRSLVAVGALVEALEHRDARVRRAAWKALRAITGVELPPDPAAWARFEG